MSTNRENPRRAAIAPALDRFRDGDAVAAEVLARRACRLALRTAAAILHSREEASDVAQDVAVEVLRSVRKLRDPDAFDAWVHRITVRQVLALLRRRRTTQAAETPLALLPEARHPAAPKGSDRDAVLAARQVLAAALAELPPKQRLALVLRYVHDLPDAEIAPRPRLPAWERSLPPLSRTCLAASRRPARRTSPCSHRRLTMSIPTDERVIEATFAAARTLEPTDEEIATSSPGRPRPPARLAAAARVTTGWTGAASPLRRLPLYCCSSAAPTRCRRRARRSMTSPARSRTGSAATQGRGRADRSARTSRRPTGSATRASRAIRG